MDVTHYQCAWQPVGKGRCSSFVAIEGQLCKEHGNGDARERLLLYMEEKTKKMMEICRAKNADYTGSAIGPVDPFANFVRVEALGICTTEVGFLTRMTDKLCRIASFVAKGVLMVKDESVEDTLLDLANYCLLFGAYLAEKRRKGGGAG